MATLSWVPARRRWRVRWRATNRNSHSVLAGSRVFLEKHQAARFWAEMEAQENLFRTGEANLAESIADAAAAFQRYCTRHTHRTQDLYARVIRQFLAALPRPMQRVQQIDAAAIEEHLYELRDAGACNRTLNAHLTGIKAFCRFAADRANLPNPARKVPMLTEDPPQSRFLTGEEFQALLAAAGPLARDRILFLANTGLRASEFCTLVRSGRLTPAADSITVIGKGRRRRTVPLNETCRQVLARPEITRPTGRNPLYQQLARVAKRAKVPPLGPHSLRHWFATQMLLRGVPIAIVAKLLGHSVRVCETTYAHILPQDLQGVTQVLDAHPREVVKEP